MGFIGGIASAIIGNNASKRAAKSANQGYNYLKDNPLTQQQQQQGLAAGQQLGALYGLGGRHASDQAFDAFRNSTGYQFRLGQGLSGIEQSAAAHGLLNSGSTLKGLMDYGQNLASAEFANYAQGLANLQAGGVNAVSNVASQGTSSGAAAGNFRLGGAQAISGGLGSALGSVSNYMEQNQPQTYQRFGWLG